MSHAQEISILMEKRVILELEGVILDAKKRMEKCREKIRGLKAPTENGRYWRCNHPSSCGEVFTALLFGPCPYCGKEDVKKITEEEYEEAYGNGPYWLCECGKKCSGWRGDKHFCPYCGSPNLKAISHNVYEEADNG